jgi:hypothetical protein
MTKTSLNLHQRMAKVQAEITYIQKEKKAGMNYTIVSHDAVTAKVRPAMVAHGILYYPVFLDVKQEGNRTQAIMSIRFANVDDPSDFIDVATFGHGIDTQDKGPGKAMSYAVKYALLKALGLETGDDPDFDQDVSYENPNDPHIAAIAAFMSEVDLAKSVTELADAAARHKPALTKAEAAFPAKVASARSSFTARKHALGQTNGATA